MLCELTTEAVGPVKAVASGDEVMLEEGARVKACHRRGRSAGHARVETRQPSSSKQSRYSSEAIVLNV